MNMGTLSQDKALVLKRDRRIIFAVVLGITFLGILMVYEASSVYSFKNFSDAAYFFKKQFLFFLIGLLFFFLVLFIDLDFLRKNSKKILILTILCLAVVIFLGREAGGAKRWLRLGGFNIQPSEILKITFLIYCAEYYRRKKNFIRSVRFGLIPLGIVLAVISLLLLLQPDMGTAIFWGIWVIFFLFRFNARKKHLLLIIFLCVAASAVLIKLYPYRLRRITSYLDPFSDPKGSGFQLIQSQIAFGEGGVFGVGLGEGRQKLFFLPAAHTDFVFAIIAEEFGLIGSLTLIFIFIFLLYKMFRIAGYADDDFTKGVCWGIIFIFFLEIVLNIGVSCGLLPTKGLPLPFMSYGGSNLVVHYIILGIFFNASNKRLKTANAKRGQYQ